MAAEIDGDFDTKTELIGGEKGIFDVHADGDLIYSKHETGRFPERAEVLDALHKRDG